MPIPWLIDVLRGAGVQVVEEGNWQARGVSGSFNPIGVLWHHTAGVTSTATNPAPSLNVCINGRGGDRPLQGPLCHALVDYHGVFHLISANRANHAGASRGSGPIPVGDGNTMLVGWEIDYNGVSQQMTAAQYNASVAATAAVLKQLGRDANHARGHIETSTENKIDPAFVNLDQMRADVANRMRGGDTPVIGNWDGAGPDDVGIFRPSESRYHLRLPDGSTRHVPWGDTGDVPVIGNWDGAGPDDVGIFRPRESRFHLRLPNGSVRHVPWGDTGDVPVTGDWDGDGIDDVGIYRPRESRFHLRLPNGSVRHVPWGDTGDIPVAGDWSGDGVDDVGIYRPRESRFHLRMPDGQVRHIPWGDVGDVPVIGDWSGDGIDDVGIYRRRESRFHLRMPDGSVRHIAWGVG
ncbi:N-acetylmuramoyl-L-alanine amidase [Kribbella sp. NPDC056345]|uniref:peptidoglycan recognition protein family protein n=1 Tax=Kribbella sp. NPDC056345 TaxID=3345789 RepID=UPI0035E3B290